MKSTRIVFTLLAAASLTVACGEEEEEASPTVGPKKPVAAAPAETVEPEKKDDDASYSYEVMVNGQMRRDPFKTYYEDLVPENPGVDPKNMTELQRIDLDKLKLVAVVVGTATPMAMVEDSTGRGFTLKIGTLIGKRLGQVKHIRRGEVVVQEEFRDFTGKRIPQLKELKLEEPQVP